MKYWVWSAIIRKCWVQIYSEDRGATSPTHKRYTSLYFFHYFSHRFYELKKDLCRSVCLPLCSPRLRQQTQESPLGTFGVPRVITEPLRAVEHKRAVHLGRDYDLIRRSEVLYINDFGTDLLTSVSEGEVDCFADARHERELHSENFDLATIFVTSSVKPKQNEASQH